MTNRSTSLSVKGSSKVHEVHEFQGDSIKFLHRSCGGGSGWWPSRNLPSASSTCLQRNAAIHSRTPSSVRWGSTVKGITFCRRLERILESRIYEMKKDFKIIRSIWSNLHILGKILSAQHIHEVAYVVATIACSWWLLMALIKYIIWLVWWDHH